MSFYKWSLSKVLAPIWLGSENYIRLLTDERFLMSVWRTLLFTVVAVAIETALGLLIALLLNRSFWGKYAVKTLFLLPMVSTPVAVGLVWMLIYEPTIGIANYLLHFLGIPSQVWLGSESTALMSLVIVDIWQWTPMMILIILGGLSVLPSEPYESAVVDGANKLQIFRKVTLPLLSSTILVAILLRMIDVLKTFDIIYATTQGGPNFSSETINILGYVQAFQYFDFGYASSILVVFFLFIFLISVFFIKIKKLLEVDL